MKTMKKLAIAIALAAVAAAAAAQEFPTEPYEFILAKLAAGEGRYDEALSRLDRVIAANPGNPILLYERAVIQIDAGRMDRAEADLRKVVGAHPELYDAQRVLGRLLLDRAGNDKTRLDDALAHLQAAFKINPDDIGTGMAVSQLLVAQGRAADAEKVVAALLERVPDQRALNYNYAQILTKLGRGDESRQYLERAVQLDPTFGPAILQLLDLYQKENEWKRAAQVLQPLIDDDPANLELQRQQAYFWLRAGNPEKARTTFKALVDADPKDTRSQFYLAEALNDLERYEEADGIYRGLLEKTPEEPDLLASFGLSQIGQKKYDEAAKTFHSLLAVKDVPDNLQVLARTQLAFIELQRGNNAAAIAGAKDVLVFHDNPNAQAINVALEALKKEGKYREAVLLLQPIVDKFASDAFVNARYIEMLLRSGDTLKAHEAAATQAKFGVRNTIAVGEAFISVKEYPAALVLLTDAVKNKPDELDLRFELGSAYERAGDRTSAERMFLQILDKNPDHAATLNYLGYMWAENGVNLERAAEMLNKAVTQEPRNGAYIDSLGWIYFRQGKLDLAEKYLTDATRLLPRDATVHEHLGDVLAKRGDYVRALSLYRVALGLDPESKDEDKIRSKIAEVEKQTTAQTSQRQ
jgi:tetratricopeptide (TPR) repeat protein